VFPSFLLSLREGLEVALILGIVLGTLRKLNRANDAKVVWFGASSAILLSLFFAVILHWLGASLEGFIEEIYEGTMMFMAAGVLTWVIFWMQRQSRSLRSQIEADVRQTSQKGGRQALFTLAFLMVLREGAELAIFLTTTAITSGAQSVLLGAVLGLGTAIFLGWSLFTNLIRLNVKRFFQITSVLLLFFAAGLVAQGIHEFNEIGWIPALVEHVWNINPWLDEESVLGQMLKALFGYNGNPSLSEVLGYLLYWGGMFWGIRWMFLSSAAPQRA
jgi:high-affinity iron transporter